MADPKENDSGSGGRKINKINYRYNKFRGDWDVETKNGFQAETHNNIRLDNVKTTEVEIPEKRTILFGLVTLG